MEIIGKVGSGEWSVYLYECPRCGCTRELDEEKVKGVLAVSAISAAGSAVCGSPIAGILGGIGLAKLALAGTISGGMAVQAIKFNYEIVKKLNERHIFTCPVCKCSDIINKYLPVPQDLLFARIRDIVVGQIGVNVEQVVPDAVLVDDLGADELDQIEVVMAIEEEFGCVIPMIGNSCSFFRTVGNIYNYLRWLGFDNRGMIT